MAKQMQGLRTLACVLLGAAALGLAVNRGLYQRLSLDAFFSVTLASYVLVLVAVSRTPFVEFLQSTLVGAGLTGMQAAVLKVPIRLLPSLALLGAAGMLLKAAKSVVGTQTDNKFERNALLPPLLLVLYGYFGASFLGFTTVAHAETLDSVLYRFDQGLGLQVSCLIGRWLIPHRWMVRSAVALYYSLPVPIMLVYALQLRRDSKVAVRAALAFFLAGVFGVVLYNLVPACGPIYLLGSKFPSSPPAPSELGALQVQGGAPRNAFPSLHLAWALLIWWYSKEIVGWVRTICLCFLFATAITILGIGEHYFVDLVAALPFSVAVEAVCAPPEVARTRRLGAFLAGLGMLLGWVGLFRSRVEIRNTLLCWLLVAITATASLFLHEWLGAARSFEPGRALE